MIYFKNSHITGKAQILVKVHYTVIDEDSEGRKQ